MQSFSGNKNDYQAICEVVDGLRLGLLNGEKVYYVADSSFLWSTTSGEWDSTLFVFVGFPTNC